MGPRFRPAPRASVEYFNRFGVTLDTLRDALARGGPVVLTHRVRRTTSVRGGQIRTTETADFDSASGNAPGSPKDFTFVAGVPERYPVRRSWEDVSIAELEAIASGVARLARARDSRIAEVTVHLRAEHGAVLHADARGNLFEDLRPLVELRVACAALDRGRTAFGSHSISGRADLHFLSPEAIDRVVETAVTRATSSIGAVAIAGDLPIVIEAGGAGLLLFAMLRAPIGTRIGRGGLNVVDDPTLPYARGTSNINGGVVCGITPLVTGGVLRSAPLHAVWIRDGNDPAIADVKHGIHCEAVGEGLVLEGARRIENGRLAGPIRGSIDADPRALRIERVASGAIADARILDFRGAPVSAGSPAFRLGATRVR